MNKVNRTIKVLKSTPHVWRSNYIIRDSDLRKQSANPRGHLNKDLTKAMLSFQCSFCEEVRPLSLDPGCIFYTRDFNERRWENNDIEFGLEGFVTCSECGEIYKQRYSDPYRTASLTSLLFSNY